MVGLSSITGILSQDMAIDLGTANTLVYVKGRGVIFFHILRYLRNCRPKTFVLENVCGILKIADGAYHRTIMECLAKLGLVPQSPRRKPG